MKSTFEIRILPYFVVAVVVCGGILSPVEAQMTCTCTRDLDNPPEDLSSSNSGPRFSNPGPSPTRPSPTPPSPTPPVAGRLGVHQGIDFPTDLDSVEILKPSFVRVGGLNATTPASFVQSVADEYARRGAAMIALVDFNDDIDLPDDNAALNVATWATISNLAAIEYGNEPYIQPNWDYEAYARSFKIVNDAVLAANPDMIVIAAGDSAEQSQRPGFQVLCALKCLGVRPRAIQLHPYGPNFSNRLLGTRIDLMNVDPDWVDMDIWITEVGVATDNGVALVPDNYGWPTDLTYSQAADTLETIVNGLVAEDNVKKVVIYRGTDNKDSGLTNDREDYFGLLLANADGNKGALTPTAIDLLNIYRSP